MILSKKDLNIAIIGLSLNKLNELKTHIESIMPVDYSVNWVAANQQGIDLLMIDHYFFDSPNLQKIIVQSNTKALKLKTSAESAGTIENNTLYLPASGSGMLRQWFKQNMLGHNTSSTTQPTAKPSPQSVPKKINFQIFSELFNPQNGKIFIYDANQTLAIADPRKELVWITQNPDSVYSTAYITDSSLNYTHAKANEVARLHLEQPQDLRQWLWQLVWNSTSYHSLVPANHNLQLDFWPQPASSSDRRDILKIAACFQQGANIEQVAHHLSIPVNRVQGFASACLAAGLAHTIRDSDTKFRPNNQSQESAANAGLRGFFGKLRKRFGL